MNLKNFVAIDKRLLNVTKDVRACRSKRQNYNNCQEKRGTLGFRGNRQSVVYRQENFFVAIDCVVRRVTKKQTESRGNRLNLLSYLSQFAGPIALIE